LSAAEELTTLFSSPTLTEALARTGVEWNPKRAFWFGGFWEQLIGMTKLALKKVLGRAFTTLNSLQTLIVEIESILNHLLLSPQTSMTLTQSLQFTYCTVGRLFVCPTM